MSTRPQVSPEPEGWEGFIKALAASVFRPIINWILHSGWLVRALALFLIGVAWICWSYRDWVADVGKIALEIPAAIVHPDSLSLTLVEQKYIDLEISALGGYLGAELQRANDKDPDHNVWATAQEVVATAHLNPIDSKFIDDAIRAKRNKICDCYTEYGEGKYPHSASANWAAVAFAQLGLKLPHNDLEFILHNEHHGWWSAFPAQDDKQNASTYATAWSVLALNAQLTAGLIDGSDKTEVEGAIERGKAWLLSSQVEHGRWMDYPYAPSGMGKRSIGLSGLVLHVLHRLRASTPDLDREWLNNLPSELSASSDSDANPYAIRMPESHDASNDDEIPSELDGVRQLRLPWTIIGTFDAYPSGDFIQRAKALRYIRNVTDSLNVLTKPVYSGMPWAASELEIAIRYLRHNQPPNQDPI